MQGEQTTDSNNNLSDWWNFQWETYMSALFHPMASLTRPMARQDDLEVRRDLSKVASGGGGVSGRYLLYVNYDYIVVCCSYYNNKDRTAKIARLMVDD